MKTERKTIRLFLPAFNAGEALRGVLEQVREVSKILPERGYKLETLVINDGSTDGTGEIAREFSRAPFSPIAVRERQNQGNALTLLEGCSWGVEASIVAWMDSDGEHSPYDLLHALSILDEGTVTGVVGCVTYPSHLLKKLDRDMMGFFGRLQAEAVGVEEWTLQAPGFQVHQAQYVEAALEMLPAYRKFFEERFGPLPRWGTNFVLDALMRLAGAQFRTMYLGCFGDPPNRTPEKALLQADAAMRHLRAFKEFKTRE